ncbi:MAG: PAS domain-containing sensor histidine kinase [Thermoplasmatota archaeon]
MLNEPDIVKKLRQLDQLKKVSSNQVISNQKLEESPSPSILKVKKDDYLKSYLFDCLLRTIPDSIFFKDKEGRFIEVSEAKIHHLGIEKHNIIGKTDFDYYSSEDAQKMRNDELYIMQHGKIIKKTEHIKRGDGLDTWNSVIKAPFYDNEGNVIGILGISRDVTKEKISKEKLVASEQKFRAIFENSAVAFTITDEKERITSWNTYAEHLLNMNKKDLFLLPVKSLYPPDEWEKIRLKNIRQKGMQHRLETKILRKNKEPLDIDISLSVVRNYNDSIVGTIGIIKDISHRKKAEQRVKEANKMLQSFNYELEDKIKERTKEIEALLIKKDEFIKNLGHDLKTPLTPLNSLLQLILQKETNEKSKELLEICLRNVNYITNVVKKTINLVILDSTSYAFDFENFDATKIIDNVIQKNFSGQREKIIQIYNTITEKLIIKADSLRFEELINNLLSNAVKYSKDNTKIIIDAKTKNDLVTFSIKDKGLGMTSEQIEKVFDEFYKGDESRNDFHSNGLGMSICKRIVDRHGGTIWVESQGLGKGSTIYFTMKKG